MLQQRAEEYYKQGYNCAETILRAANDEYRLGLEEDALRLAAGFGGGMGCGGACGALTGGVCAVSSLLVRTNAHQTPALRPQCARLVAAFRRVLGDTECKNLMRKYKKPDRGCLDTVLLGCQALEEALAEGERGR